LLPLPVVDWIEGQPASPVTVARFTDPDPDARPSRYRAVIDWGDGFLTTASAAEGTIVATDSIFEILGSHVYRQPAEGLGLSVKIEDTTAGLWSFDARQVVQGGPDDVAYQQGTHTLTSVVCVAHLSELVGTAGLYDPRLSGAVTALEYAYDFRVLSAPSSGSQVGVSVMVKQGNNYYLADYGGAGQEAWVHRVGRVTAADFWKLTGDGPSQPDFSATGTPLEIGYFTANSGSGLHALTWGLADFELTINGTTYADQTFRDADWTHLALFDDDLGGIEDAEQTTVHVAPAPLTVTLAPLAFVEGQSYEQVSVASVTHRAIYADPALYRAVVDWGDGIITTASVADGGMVRTVDGFDVLGSHTYRQAAATLGVPFAVRVEYATAGVFSATVQQVSGGGPDDAPYQQGTHTLTNTVCAAHLSELIGTAGLYDPRLSGAVTTLEYAYDFRVLSAPSSEAQVGVSLLVKQASNYYLADYGGAGQEAWVHRVGRVTAADFWKVAGDGPNQPDFSAAGAPLEIGYFTANSGSGSLQTLIWGLANFELTINGTTFSDRTFRDADWIHLVLYGDDLGGIEDAEQATVNVAPAPLMVTLAPSAFVEGQSYEHVPVASVTHRAIYADPALYRAVVDWGDGTITTASVADGGMVRTVDGFDVLGSHSYRQAATALGVPFTVRVEYAASRVFPATAQQMSRGGPDDSPYQQGAHTLTSTVVVAHVSAKVGSGGVYDSREAGEITSLTYAYDFRVLSAPSTSDLVGVGLLVKQGYNYYVAGYIGVGEAGWSHCAGTVNVSDLVKIAGSGPSVPDFSAMGAPLEFGYLTANDSGGERRTLTWGIAGFEVAINGLAYGDPVFRDTDWTHWTLCNDDLGALRAEAPTTVVVADAPLTLAMASLSFVAGVPYDRVVVATFTDANPPAQPSEYKAVIDWGDGFISTASAADGTIVRDGAEFQILGSHTYREPAADLRFRVTVEDQGWDNSVGTLRQMPDGGPDGAAYQYGVMTFTSLAYLAQFAKPGTTVDVYDPAQSGPINTLDYAFDFQTLDATGGPGDELGVALLLKQGYNFYLVDYQGVGQSEWHHLTGSGIAGSCVKLLGAGPDTPDFSSSGAPLEFGYFVAHTCLGWQQMTWGMADFQVVINGTLYSDPALRNSDWTQLVLLGDDLGASRDAKDMAITVASRVA
jgi:hypothetical protein